MLYLSRKLGESIIINETIELTIEEIKGKSVKLGFVFPSDASILRKELHDKIREQNVEAMSSMGDDMFDDLSFDPSGVVGTSSHPSESDHGAS